MKIYTKTGDRGQTGLIGGERVDKDAPVIQAVGDIDELNSALGLCRCDAFGSLIEVWLSHVQNWLFDLGAEIATPANSKFTNKTIGEKQIGWLERSIDEQTEGLEPLKNFILPGGTNLAAHLHHARSICRRAERSVTSLAKVSNVRDEVIMFTNRLSDWLFVTARTANSVSGVQDVIWTRTEDLPND